MLYTIFSVKNNFNTSRFVLNIVSKIKKIISIKKKIFVDFLIIQAYIDMMMIFLNLTEAKF